MPTYSDMGRVADEQNAILREEAQKKRAELAYSRAAIPKPIQERATLDEADNLVMQRDPLAVAGRIENVVNPDIPITQPVSQSIETGQASIAPISAAVPIEPIQAREMALEPGDKLLSDLDKHQKRIEDSALKDKDDRSKRIGELEAKLAEREKTPFKFDDRSMWEKSSTGQKIALLIGGALSSLTPGSAKTFQDGVQNSIKADLDQQKAKFDERRDSDSSLFAQLHKEYGNQEAAGLAWESIVYKGIAGRLAYQRDIANSAQQKQAADRTHNLAMQEGILKANQANQKADFETSKKSIIGYEGTIPDATQKRNFEDAIVAGASMREQLQILRTITARTGKSLFPESRAEAKSAIGLLMADYKTFKKLGTLDKGVEGLFEKLVQNPTKFLTIDSSSLAMINAFDKSITSGIRKSAEVHGLKPAGINSYVEGQ